MERWQRGLNSFLARQVDGGLDLLEAGCGSGNLTLQLAPRAASIAAVELSPRMLAHARRRAERARVENVEFVEGDVSRILNDRDADSFDLAVMVLVLHEMPQEIREASLRELVRLAGRVLLVDFHVPQPPGLASVRNHILERIAGRMHYRAFRDYCGRGGAPGIAAEMGLSCDVRRRVDGGTLAVCEIA